MTRWQYIIPGWKNFQHWFVALHLSAFRLFLLMDSSNQHVTRWSCFFMWSQRIYPLTLQDLELGPQKRETKKKKITRKWTGVLKSNYFRSKLYACFSRVTVWFYMQSGAKAYVPRGITGPNQRHQMHRRMSRCCCARLGIFHNVLLA